MGSMAQSLQREASPTNSTHVLLTPSSNFAAKPNSPIQVGLWKCKTGIPSNPSKNNFYEGSIRASE